MPMYEYKCHDCGTEFEFMKIRSDEVAECPRCGAQGEEKLEQLISRDTGFVLKGRGWARDRYSGGGGSNG